MPPDPPRSSALRASLLPLRVNYISHSIQTKNLGIYVKLLALLHRFTRVFLKLEATLYVPPQTSARFPRLRDWKWQLGIKRKNLMHLSMSSRRGGGGGGRRGTGREFDIFKKIAVKFPNPGQKCEVKYNWNSPPGKWFCVHGYEQKFKYPYPGPQDNSNALPPGQSDRSNPPPPAWHW